MSSFDIPTSPPIAENKLTYRIHNQKAHRANAPECRSFTYDHEKGGMTREWADADAFLAWLATEETEKSVELILSEVEQSDSTIWQEQRLYRCARQFTSGKKDWERTTKSERAIPSKKTGCQCHVTIKLYPHTDKVLGKYDDKHNHAIGEENLRFTRLSDNTKEHVMEFARAGVDSNAIVRSDYVACFSTDSYLAKTHAGILHKQEL